MSKIIDLKGQRFGKLTVLERDMNIQRKPKYAYWACQCDCGNIKSIQGRSLIAGTTKSCGCSKTEIKKNLVGEKFGKLQVKKYAGRTVDGKILYECECECGNTKIVRAGNLTSGNANSCGCVTRRTHGASKEKLFHVWYDMIRRCENPESKQYHNYGERGIVVCEEWHDYEAFKQWAYASGYKPPTKRGELTIDRIDVNGDYEPSNCQWVSQSVQTLNQRRNVYYEIGGEKKTLTEWAKAYGINRKTLYARVHHGFPIEIAVATPVWGLKKGDKICQTK